MPPTSPPSQRDAAKSASWWRSRCSPAIPHLWADRKYRLAWQRAGVPQAPRA